MVFRGIFGLSDDLDGFLALVKFVEITMKTSQQPIFTRKSAQKRQISHLKTTKTPEI
jgi:hypothetical protein